VSTSFTGAWAAPPRGLHALNGTEERRQSPARSLLNERPERHLDDTCLRSGSHGALRLPEEVVVDVQCRSHARKYASSICTRKRRPPRRVELSRLVMVP
jgi:hypothetical protein